MPLGPAPSHTLQPMVNEQVQKEKCEGRNHSRKQRHTGKTSFPKTIKRKRLQARRSFTRGPFKTPAQTALEMKANYSINAFHSGTLSAFADNMGGRRRGAGSTGGASWSEDNTVVAALDSTPPPPRFASLSVRRVVFTHSVVVTSAIAVATGIKLSPSLRSCSVTHHDRDTSMKKWGNGPTSRVSLNAPHP
jgi:hypothetical protein